MFVAAWLLCALCSSEGEIGSTSYAPTIPKGKAVACVLSLPGSPNGAPDEPFRQPKGGAHPHLIACSHAPTPYS